MTFIKFGEFKEETYKEVPIYAHEQIHEKVAQIIDKFSLPHAAKILDIAAGPGAFSLRLKDKNYDIEAIDIDATCFKPQHIPFYQLDLNDYHAVEKFSKQKKNTYDLIISMETIEHIENPWLLLGLLKNICKPDGYILLTTPNIESIFSRFSFLFTSKFQHFRREDLSWGHINPLTSFEIKHAIDSLGLKLESIMPIGTYPLIYLHKKIIDSIIWTIANLVLYPFLKGYKTGWCLCYCIKKI